MENIYNYWYGNQITPPQEQKEKVKYVVLRAREALDETLETLKDMREWKDTDFDSDTVVKMAKAIDAFQEEVDDHAVI